MKAENKEPQDIRERSFKYALRAIKLYKLMKETEELFAVITAIIVRAKRTPHR